MELDKSRPQSRVGNKRERGAAGLEAPKSRGIGPGRAGRNRPVVGSYVSKDFPGAGSLLGKVVSYGGRLYKAFYEDGRLEDLELREICQILVQQQEEEQVDGDAKAVLGSRKRKLDQLISAGGTRTLCTRSRKNAEDDPGRTKTSSASGLASGLGEDADSSSDSCDSVRAPASTPAPENPRIQALPLPPSSGDIGVPEEAVPYLLSVYSFLRSFSHRLFLSPFGLDDFVGSLNCTVHNSLLDAVHVSLMRTLRRHLEMLSSDGSHLASRCLRHSDWTLLDNLTWPVFLIDYLYIVPYPKGVDWKGLHMGILDGEYYGLPVTTKLKVLQILCDDVVESEELRTELGMREDMEEEKECNANASLLLLEDGPRRVHPRYSKTSACKDLEALENAAAPDKSHLNCKVVEPDKHAADVSDGNSDECRLCGMDGTLICCDGCPSAYHSRCIGLNKAFLPDGMWFCPECMVNKTGPTSSIIGKGIRGAEIFGIDPYQREFLGTCNYLLVLEVSTNADPLSRYYNQNDVIEVIRVLCATGQTSFYADICKGISKYWEIPLNFLQHKRNDPVTTLLVEMEAAMDSDSSRAIPAQEMLNVMDRAEGKNYASNITESKNLALSRLEFSCIEAGVNDSLDSEGPVDDPPDSQKCTSDEKSAMKVTEALDKTLVLSKNYQAASKDANMMVQKTLPFIQTKNHEQLGRESAISSGSHSLATDISDSSHQRYAERSSVLDFGSCASGNGDGACREDADSIIFPTKNDPLSFSHESQQCNHIYGRKSRYNIDVSSYLGAFFKPQAYSNQYILGEVAASAAANLAVLAPEESRVSEDHVSSNPRKILEANISLQIKAFSATAMQFLWSSSEKKLMEVPREKCGWCIACKGAATNKKGCLLNLAASNAIRGAARGLRSLRPIKNNDSNIPAIAAHVLHMEESLRGLLVGPLLDVDHNKQWCRVVKEASTCRVLKFLLLDLEKGIRGIVFSAGWLKLVDDWSVEFSATQSSMCSNGSTQKRGLGGRWNRKSTTSETIPVPCHETWKHVQWWRGGKLSKVLFQKGILPASLAKKAARQGGFKRVPGIQYSDSPEIPRRSRQLAWRAAVEMSRNASQLALQVRYLDAHVRWRDIVRPEQIPLDGKVADVEASAFRNAVICDRTIVENKIRYGLAFGNQKHLPLRVMKNILEEEKSQDHHKLWFSENHVPLYLIKEYEEQLDKVSLPSKKILKNCWPEFQRKLSKACHRDIFSYLLHTGEKPSKFSCASCQQDVLLRHAVRCYTCQGYCHKDCITPSVADREDYLNFIFLCKLCYQAENARIYESHKESLKGQLSYRKDLIVTGAKEPVINMGVHSKMRTCPSDSNSARKARCGMYLTYGLIWKKKKSQECGTDFRLNHIILRGSVDMETSRQPICSLCHMPYNPDLMYIRCEKCLNWFHADAVHLEEDQIFNLIGFKCCKCRRKSSPYCPYAKKPELKPLKQGSAEEKLDSAVKNQGSMSQSVSFELPKTVEQTTLVSSAKVDLDAVEDPFLFSLESVEPLKGPISEADIKLNSSKPILESPQKLSVRRSHVDHVVYATQEAKPESSAPSESQQKLPVESQVNREMDFYQLTATQEANLANTTEKASYSQVEWGFSGVDGYEDKDFNPVLKDHLVDAGDVSMEDMEYEPQTYFTFTELLASENDEVDGLLDMPMDMSENWCVPSGFDVIGTDRHAMSSYGSEPNAMGLAEIDIVAGETALNWLRCEKCKLNQPSPDLTCEICGMHIHSHCSPWVEDDRPFGDTQWRCGSCRDGR